MIVVSDSSPLNILIRIGYADLLYALFQSVIIPPSVASELSHNGTPEPVRRWISAPPSWLRIQAPRQLDSSIGFDGRGEGEAISLALELHADLLLADDRKARKVAQSRGLVVTGAVGVLEAAATRNLLDLSSAFEKLRMTDFIIASSILEGALRRDAERRRT